MPQINEGLPIILVTAYPTLNSAIQSIQLPVVAYLIKPVEHDELLLQVRSSIKNFRVRSVITRRRDHLQNWRKNLAVVDQVDNGARTTATAMPITAFVDLTFQNITGALFDLKHLTETLTTNRSPRETCHLFNCPRLSILTDALMETIAVLEKTKSSFKSKELGELRKKLEKLVKNGHSQPVHDASTA
jgi:response regulator RpfG family c-di-GMP phosphodiesterase